MNTEFAELIRRAHKQADAHTTIRTVIQSRCDNPQCAERAGDNACPEVGCGRCDVTASRIVDALQKMAR